MGCADDDRVQDHCEKTALALHRQPKDCKNCRSIVQRGSNCLLTQSLHFASTSTAAIARLPSHCLTFCSVTLASGHLLASRTKNPADFSVSEPEKSPRPGISILSPLHSRHRTCPQLYSLMHVAELVSFKTAHSLDELDAFG